MTDIKGLSNNLPLTIAPERQTEDVSQQQNQIQNDLTVACNSDTLEQAPSNGFDFLHHSEDSVEQPSPRMVEAVPLSSVMTTKTEGSSRLQELQDRLNQLEQKKEELRKQLLDAKSQLLEMQKAASAINESLEKDEPLSEEMLTFIAELGGLGAIGGILAGLPVVSIVSGLLGGISGGLSEAYKQKLHEASAKLNHGMGEINASAAKISEELDGVNQEEDSLEHKIHEEERRLEQRFTEQKSDTDLMTVQTPWEEFVSPENMIETNSTPSEVPLIPDVQNFSKDE